MSFFPTSVPTALELLQAKNNISVTLSAAINDVITTIPVVDTSNLPSSGYLTFEDGSNEVISYTGKTITSLTGVTRGTDGTVASSHADAGTIGMWWNAKYHNILADEIIGVAQNLSTRIGLGTQDIVNAQSIAGGILTVKVSNSSAAAASSARMWMQVTATSTGDPYLVFQTPTGFAAMGLDTSDSSKFKLAMGDVVLGTVNSLTVSQAGVFGINTATPISTFGGLDISSGGLSLVVGADSNALTRTNSTQKFGRFASAHYTNAEEPLGLIVGNVNSSVGEIYIGGGTSIVNAATAIYFYTAANNTTVTGTERIRIDSAGLVGIGITPSWLLHLNKSQTLTPTSGDGQLAIDNSSVTTTDCSAILLNSQGTRRAQISGGKGAGTNDGFLAFTTRRNSDGTFLERMRIEESGKVLINVTTARTIGGVIAPFQVEGTNSNTSSMSVTRNSADTNSPYIMLLKSRGAAVGSFTVVQSGDGLGDIYFCGTDGVDAASYGARISAFVDGTPGTGDMPGRLVFYTTLNGAASATERMRITNDGLVGIGKTPVFPFDVSNGSDVIAVFESSWANSSGSSLYLRHTRGTAGAHTIVNNGDTLRIRFQGSDGAAYRTISEIVATVNGSPGSSDMPGKLSFYTTPDGSATSTERMNIDNTGIVSVITPLTNALYVLSSFVGDYVGAQIENTDNTNAASGARLLIKSGGTSAGDPLVRFRVGTTTDWAIGIDNSDSDKFKISASATIGTSDTLTIDTAGLVTLLSTNSPTCLLQASVSGNYVGPIIDNTSNTASSDALLYLRVAGTSAGDPWILFRITSGSPASWSVGVDNSDSDKFKISAASGLGSSDALIIDSSLNVSIAATKNLYLDGGGNTFITEVSADVISMTCGGTNVVQWAATAYNPVGTGLVSTGTATNYWNDISYKTLTDRGCLPYCDEGVEMADGKIVTDLEAILSIKKHPTKKTIHGLPMLDYKTFPKKAYRPADDGGVLLPRDEKDEPIGGSDGIEMTMMFGVMLGAFKELEKKIALLEKKNN